MNKIEQTYRQGIFRGEEGECASSHQKYFTQKRRSEDRKGQSKENRREIIILCFYSAPVKIHDRILPDVTDR